MNITGDSYEIPPESLDSAYGIVSGSVSAVGGRCELNNVHLMNPTLPVFQDPGVLFRYAAGRNLVFKFFPNPGWRVGLFKTGVLANNGLLSIDPERALAFPSIIWDEKTDAANADAMARTIYYNALGNRHIAQLMIELRWLQMTEIVRFLPTSEVPGDNASGIMSTWIGGFKSDGFYVAGDNLRFSITPNQGCELVECKIVKNSINLVVFSAPFTNLKYPNAPAGTLDVIAVF